MQKWKRENKIKKKEASGGKGKRRTLPQPLPSYVGWTGSMTKGTLASKAASRRTARPKQTRRGKGVLKSIGQTQPFEAVASGVPLLLGAEAELRVVLGSIRLARDAWVMEFQLRFVML
jgi:hypothetical protein